MKLSISLILLSLFFYFSSSQVVLNSYLAPLASNSTAWALVTIASAPAGGVDLTITGSIPALTRLPLALYVYTNGDISSASALGSIYGSDRPGSSRLCYPNSQRYWGVLGNVTTNSNGTFSTTIYSELLSVFPGDLGYVGGRGIALRSLPDLCNQPNDTIGAGVVVVAGVIGYQEESNTVFPTVDSFPNNSTGIQLTCTFSNILEKGYLGRVVFQDMGKGTIAVITRITGVTANKTYALGIYQFGDISDSEGFSVGEVLDFTGNKHGCPTTPKRQTGDLGNFVATAPVNSTGSGVINSVLMITGFSLSPTNPQSIVGRAVILQDGEDNCIDNPNNWNRIGQCVIGLTSYQQLIPVAPAPSSAEISKISIFLLAFSFLYRLLN